MTSELTTKEKIIQAMYSLAAERGYDKASIGLICQKVGITKPSVYFYFKNKEEIFVEAIRSIFDTKDSQLPEYGRVQTPKEYREVLLLFGYVIIGNFHIEKERQRFMSEITTQSARLEPVRQFLQEHRQKRMEELEKFIQHGFSIGAFSEDKDVNSISQLLDILLVSIGDRILIDPEFNGRAIWELLVSSICVAD